MASSGPTIVPTAVKLDVAANALTITWADGHVSHHDGAHLRQVCPCASCRGHSPGERPPPTWEQVKDVRLTGVRPVGSYALHLDLSDGHDSGIYTWAFLREDA